MKLTHNSLTAQHSGHPLFTLRDADGNGIRTIYFALRAYRDQLHKELASVMTKALSEDDYLIDPKTRVGLPPTENDGIETLDDIVDFGTCSVISEVPQVDIDVMLDSSVDYETYMFLFETLYKVNEVLFEIMHNHSEEDVRSIAHVLGV